MTMTNTLIWDGATDINGTSLLLRCDLDLAQLVALSGLDPYKTDGAYYDPDKGYDGWALTGTFNGEPFNLYTRWGCLRIGGLHLDAPALLAHLTTLLTGN
ncbi:MAG: hypothetical protein C5B54_05755 [Acidobacteria bacterium]|nr:MAG: hypothetical protein C5B54_05755 [Acidobacteriota bacterium]